MVTIVYDDRHVLVRADPGPVQLALSGGPSDLITMSLIDAVQSKTVDQACVEHE